MESNFTKKEIEIRNFVIEEIDKLLNKFPRVKCSYEFDLFDYTHYIQIEPKEFYKKVKNYLIENRVDEKFIKKYPYHGILFTSKTDIIDWEDDIYVKEGESFSDNKNNFSPKTSIDKIISRYRYKDKYNNINYNIINKQLPINTPIFLTNVNYCSEIDNEITNLTQNNNIEEEFESNSTEPLAA